MRGKSHKLGLLRIGCLHRAHLGSAITPKNRYNEGRKLFSQIIIGSRTLGRLIWYHCPDYLNTPTSDGNDEEGQDKERERNEKEIAVKEKRQAIELCLVRCTFNDSLPQIVRWLIQYPRRSPCP
jgi:hypothetical protein